MSLVWTIVIGFVRSSSLSVSPQLARLIQRPRDPLLKSMLDERGSGRKHHQPVARGLL